MRENYSLKIKVNVTLTLITFGILVMFLVVLPSLFVIDVISFVSSGTSIFFPSTNFLWFLPKVVQPLPLNLGQFLDIWVIILILFQIAASLYVVLARFFRYQPSSSEIPVEVKREFRDALPNFMRWNIFPHGQLFLGEKPENGKFGQKKFAPSHQGFQGTFSEEQVLSNEEGFYDLHRRPSSILSLIKNRSLISRFILGSRRQQQLHCNLLASHFDRFVPVPYGGRASNSPLILASSCFNPNQIREDLAEYVVS